MGVIFGKLVWSDLLRDEEAQLFRSGGYQMAVVFHHSAVLLSSPAESGNAKCPECCLHLFICITYHRNYVYSFIR